MQPDKDKYQVAEKYQKKLPDLKNYVTRSYDYFKPNNDRYHRVRNLVFNSTLEDTDIGTLAALNKPKIEFNILEAYISRLRGEFSKQEPSIVTTLEEGAQLDPQIINIVEGHLRHEFHEANKDGFEYNIYTDCLSGGYSVIKAWTEYANNRSFNQVIRFGRAHEPTLCGFDPLAEKPTKWDGRYAFELYPKTKEEFEEDFPKVDISDLSFTRNVGKFNFCYNNDKEDILLVCDMYVKKKKKVRIVELVTGHVITQQDYEELVQRWEEQGIMAQVPAIRQSRIADQEIICRYRFIENQVLEYKETDFKFFPLIFVDGNSITLRNPNSYEFQQMTRPYVYNALGIQKLKNVGGQTLAHEIEMMVQHKFKVAEESLPTEDDWLEAYTNVQLAQTLVYKAFKENNPDMPLPPPQEIPRVPIPPEVTNAFSMADATTQTILGSYDAALGINDNQLSGVAVVEGATQSNAAAMPYVVGLMFALTQLANFYVDLLPKYYVTPRTIPIKGLDGKNSYVEINPEDPNKPSFNYNENALQVKVEAGVNFAIQKARALNQIIALCQASPMFAQFINTMGLEVLLDNLEIRGIDQLKLMAQQFMKKIEADQQNAQKNNPDMLRLQNQQMEIQQKAQQNEADNAIRTAELSLQEKSLNLELMRILKDIRSDRLKAAVDMDKHNTEKARAAVDLAMDVTDLHHRHAKETYELAHQLTQPQTTGATSNG